MEFQPIASQLECRNMWSDGLISKVDYLNQRNIMSASVPDLESHRKLLSLLEMLPSK